MQAGGTDPVQGVKGAFQFCLLFTKGKVSYPPVLVNRVLPSHAAEFMRVDRVRIERDFKRIEAETLRETARSKAAGDFASGPPKGSGS
mgnify:CR=1 FL=1